MRDLIGSLFFEQNQLDTSKIHQCFLLVGCFELNDYCNTDATLMLERGSRTGGTQNFIDPHAWPKLMEAYKLTLPERAATAGRVHGRAALPSVVKSLDELIKEKKPKLSAVDIKELVRRNYAVVVQQNNPRVFNKAPWKRYENYKKAKTVAELKTLKAETGDIIKDIQMGYIKLVVPEPP